MKNNSEKQLNIVQYSNHNPSNEIHRGAGGPQAQAAPEAMMSHDI
jgi:hypothetical protein